MAEIRPVTGRNRKMNRIRKHLMKIPRTKWGKQSFLLGLKGKNARVLDVGCGNNSPQGTKFYAPDIYYAGVDVGNYNNSKDSIAMADEYHVFTPDGFAEGIESLKGMFDAAISSHNIEHCSRPEETVRAVCRKIKQGGKLYFSFPNSDSVYFPHRKGTLNFYDDNTHVYVPDMDKILGILKEEGMEIIKAVKGYRPPYYVLWGGCWSHGAKNGRKY